MGQTGTRTLFRVKVGKELAWLISVAMVWEPSAKAIVERDRL